LIKFKKKFAVLASVLLLVGSASTSCSLIQKTPDAIAKQKVAVVGGEAITRAELDEMSGPVIAQLKAQNGESFLTTDNGKATLLEQKKSLLDNMVEEKLFDQKSKELKLFSNEKEIDDAIDKNIKDLIESYKTEDELNKKLQESNISRDLLKKILRNQVVFEKVADNMVKDVTVADADVQKYYDAHKSEYTEKPNTMEVSHILLKTEQEAKDIKAKLDKGEDFAALAKQYSTEPAAKDSGGSLGELQYNDPNYDPTFVAAAMKLNQGQVSDPVLTQFGYHIIKVTKKTEYPVKTFDAAKEEVKNQLLEEAKGTKYTEVLNDWKSKAKIKINEKYINN
jgi:foldase protein PrsA